MWRGISFVCLVSITAAIAVAATYEEAETALNAAEDSANAVWLAADTDASALGKQEEAEDAYLSLAGTYYYVEDWLVEVNFDLTQAQIVQGLGDASIDLAHDDVNEGWADVYEDEFDRAVAHADDAHEDIADAYGYYNGWTDPDTGVDYYGSNDLYEQVEQEFDSIIAECDMLAAAEEMAGEGDAAAMDFLLYQMGW